MSYDYRKLRGRIVEVYGTLRNFSSAMNWSERTLSLKMNAKIAWKQPEIERAIILLKLKNIDILDYFFKIEVQNIEQVKNS